MSGTKDARTTFTVDPWVKRDIEHNADRVRELGATITNLGEIMGAVQMQLLDGDNHTPCGDCHMHEIVSRSTLFSIYNAIRELGEVIYNLGDGIESSMYKAKTFQGDE